MTLSKCARVCVYTTQNFVFVFFSNRSIRTIKNIVSMKKINRTWRSFPLLLLKISWVNERHFSQLHVSLPCRSELCLGLCVRYPLSDRLLPAIRLICMDAWMRLSIVREVTSALASEFDVRFSTDDDRPERFSMTSDKTPPLTRSTIWFIFSFKRFAIHRRCEIIWPERLTSNWANYRKRNLDECFCERFS